MDFRCSTVNDLKGYIITGEMEQRVAVGTDVKI